MQEHFRLSNSPEYKTAARSFQWSGSSSAHAENLFDFRVNRPIAHAQSLSYYVLHMIYSANQNDFGQRHKGCVQTAGISDSNQIYSQIRRDRTVNSDWIQSSSQWDVSGQNVIWNYLLNVVSIRLAKITSSCGLWLFRLQNYKRATKEPSSFNPDGLKMWFCLAIWTKPYRRRTQPIRTSRDTAAHTVLRCHAENKLFSADLSFF